MGFSSFMKSPKKEEQHEVPGYIFLDAKTDGHYADDRDENNVDIMDDLERIWGIGEEEDQKLLSGGDRSNKCQLSWDLMDWHEFHHDDEDDEEEENTKCFFEEEGYSSRYSDACNVVKREHVGFWDDDFSTVSLNLNLNHQEVLDAWSDRGTLWARDRSSEDPTNASYMGEVPVMEEDRTRREASVMRYKEKRQSRLFSKKIRYQVRKLNADKRPRLKGRFVKRV